MNGPIVPSNEVSRNLNPELRGVILFTNLIKAVLTTLPVIQGNAFPHFLRNHRMSITLKAGNTHLEIANLVEREDRLVFSATRFRGSTQIGKPFVFDASAANTHTPTHPLSESSQSPLSTPTSPATSHTRPVDTHTHLAKKRRVLETGLVDYSSKDE